MSLDKRLVYVGIGALALLIAYNSTKGMELKEVQDPSMETKNFDSSSLPHSIQPPKRLSEGEPIPTPAQRPSHLNMLGLSPRFDTP